MLRSRSADDRRVRRRRSSSFQARCPRMPLLPVEKPTASSIRNAKNRESHRRGAWLCFSRRTTSKRPIENSQGLAHIAGLKNRLGRENREHGFEKAVLVRDCDRDRSNEEQGSQAGHATGTIRQQSILIPLARWEHVPFAAASCGAIPQRTCVILGADRGKFL